MSNPDPHLIDTGWGPNWDYDPDQEALDSMEEERAWWAARGYLMGDEEDRALLASSDTQPPPKSRARQIRRGSRKITIVDGKPKGTRHFRD